MGELKSQKMSGFTKNFTKDENQFRTNNKVLFLWKVIFIDEYMPLVSRVKAANMEYQLLN